MLAAPPVVTNLPARCPVRTGHWSRPARRRDLGPVQGTDVQGGNPTTGRSPSAPASPDQRRVADLGPGERVSRRRLVPGPRCVHRRAPARGRWGPAVGGHASHRQVKGGCRHGQAWVMDRGRFGPDPGERVSVEGGALEPGSGRCTVALGAQMDNDEHDRGGTRTLRVKSKVTCGQVYSVWTTRSNHRHSHEATHAHERAPGAGSDVAVVLVRRSSSPAVAPYRATATNRSRQ
jgi:hypothetical protein